MVNQWIPCIEHGDIRWWKKISWKGIDWNNGFLYLCFNKLVEWLLWICTWVHSCLEVATFESRVAELKPCVPDLEMYISEQLQTHAVIAACVNNQNLWFTAQSGLTNLMLWLYLVMDDWHRVRWPDNFGGWYCRHAFFFAVFCLLLQRNMSWVQVGTSLPPQYTPSKTKFRLEFVS